MRLTRESRAAISYWPSTLLLTRNKGNVKERHKKKFWKFLHFCRIERIHPSITFCLLFIASYCPNITSIGVKFMNDFSFEAKQAPFSHEYTGEAIHNVLFVVRHVCLLRIAFGRRFQRITGVDK